MNILLTRLDRMGDLVVSTPAIASVRRSWPRARITLACSTYNAAVVERNPDIDELIAVPPDAPPAEVGRRFRGACDLAIALAPRANDLRLVGATRAPKRVGYTYVRRYAARLTAPFFLTDLVLSEADPELCERDPGYRVRHEAEQVLELVTRAGGTVLHPDLVVRIADEDRAAVAHLPAHGIVVHLAPRWLRDGSSLESLRALLAELRRFGRKLVVTYGPEVREEARAIAESGLVDAVAGDLRFGQWAAALERARLVVTVDTGATHVAAAMGCPTIVLFEHRYFRLCSQEWAPYRVPSAVIRKPPDEREESLRASRAEIVTAAKRLLAGGGVVESAVERN